MDSHEHDLMLLQRWRDHDRLAGNTLIERYYAFAYKVSLRLLDGDADGAQEIVQQAFETLMSKRDVIEINVKGYLRQVVMLKVLAFRRRRTVEGGTSAMGASGPGVESAVGRREEIKLMVKALRSLSLEDQLLLAWAYGERKAQREIAESLELGVAQCNSRLYRARQRLRARLEGLRGTGMLQSTRGGVATWLASVHGREGGV